MNKRSAPGRLRRTRQARNDHRIPLYLGDEPPSPTPSPPWCPMARWGAAADNSPAERSRGQGADPALARARCGLLGVPVSGFATDILIGAGCVAELQTSAVSLGEAGFAPRFTAAMRAGSIHVIDATCPAIHTMLQAAEKGVPFMPLRGPDRLRHPGEPPRLAGDRKPIRARRAHRPAACPFARLRRFHAAMADSLGQCLARPAPRMRDLGPCQPARPRHRERVVPGNFLEDDRLAPGTITPPISRHSPSPSAARIPPPCSTSTRSG
jgi:hypothetical protein